MPKKIVSDNQQERPEIIYWICGFVDGEGCFSVSIIRNQTTSLGWQVFPEFVVTQGEKSRFALEKIKEYFQCGEIYLNRRHDNHKESLLRFCVRSQKDLREKIIPFFSKFPLHTAKREDFKKFVKILQFMKRGDHKQLKGIRSIAGIIQNMNRKVPSRFLESSETTRQSPDVTSG
ncbi:endonuclease [Candidatus Uhrbacteria bacterium]|nr:endonuclease [Candidatus Uhrbacteria bacterium]